MKTINSKSSSRSSSRSNLIRRGNHSLFHLFLVKAILLSSIVLVVSSSSSTPHAHQPQPQPQPQSPPVISCDLYIAESTIPNAGLGTFTSIPRAADQPVDHGEVCIPIYDWWLHQGTKNPFYDYMWNGGAMGMHFETRSYYRQAVTTAVCPGLGSIVNSHIPLVNLNVAKPVHAEEEGEEEAATTATAATAATSRSSSSRIDSTATSNTDQSNLFVGGVTPYHSRVTKTIQPVAAGSEVFIQYVDKWFEARTEAFGLIPLSRDFPKALKLLTRTVAFVDFIQNKNVDSSVSSSWQDDFYQIVSKLGQKQWESRLWNALPQSYTQAQQVVQAQDMAVLYQDAATRSPEWLQQHGRCADHIRSGTSTRTMSTLDSSTVAVAVGRGAFARRFLPEGAVVATSPLHILPYGRDAFVTYPWLEQIPIRLYPFLYRVLLRPVLHWLGLRQQQLMQNYCWSHPQSTVMLCPYASGVSLINHANSKDGQTSASASASQTATTPNVQVRWARDFPLAHNPDILEDATTLDDIQYCQRRKSSNSENDDYTKDIRLALEYVATRDILPDEELLVDYGPAFAQAVQDHWRENSAGQRQRQRLRDYISAGDLNANEVTIRTLDEVEEKPYPKNVQIRCHYDLVTNVTATKFEWFPSDPGSDCRILKRVDQNNTYTVRILQIRGKRSKWVGRRNVPRRAIRFFPQPGTTQVHWSGAFRHEMHLPDDMFPQKWKNRKEPLSSSASINQRGSSSSFGLVLVTIYFLYECWKRLFAPMGQSAREEGTTADKQ